eukprot:GDKH01003881.1.p2 GENE.GDKH01003881.1~~GDKH01003881.1.p2  ORF type:complete len:66 (+),score=3.22 GDKH01003881.1:72-269(+)
MRRDETGVNRTAEIPQVFRDSTNVARSIRSGDGPLGALIRTPPSRVACMCVHVDDSARLVMSVLY